MKIIDVLTKIANGEEVKFKILDNDEDDEVRDEIFEVENGHLRNSTCGIWLETEVSHDTWRIISSYFLNKEVEIIEDKKIETLEPLQKEWMSLDDIKLAFSNSEMIIVNKINEIIDYLNKENK